jgi:hypothetical protein
MRITKIKFTEAQVRLLIVGETVQINLPDAQVHLTMDTTRIELRKAADKLRDLGRSRGKSKFEDLFGDIFKDKSDPFSDLFS